MYNSLKSPVLDSLYVINIIIIVIVTFCYIPLLCYIPLPTKYYSFFRNVAPLDRKIEGKPDG